MEEKVEGQPEGRVLGLWEEPGGRPHPEDVESPHRKTQNRESNPQPGEQSCPKTRTSRKTPGRLKVSLPGKMEDPGTGPWMTEPSQRNNF